MLRTKKNILFFRLCLLLGSCVQAVLAWSQVAEQSIHFDQLTFQDGLSHNTVLCVLQDRYGYVWVGTQNGLNKYDGYSFESYPSSESVGDKMGFLGKTIRTIFEDSKGNLWVGTKNRGVNFKSADRETFVNLQSDSVFQASKGQEVTSFCEDSKGNIWMGTLGNGLLKYHPETKQSRHYTKENSALSNNLVFDIVEDHMGLIWVGTQGGGINFLNTKDTFEQVYVQQEGMSDFWSSYGKTLLIDGDALWIGTEGAGLYRLDLPSRQFTYFEVGNTEETINSNLIRALYKTSTGLLYIATDGGGLNIYDPKTQKISKATNVISDHSSLNTNALYCITEDQAKNIWIGTYNGGLNIQKVNKTFFGHYSNIYDLGHPSILSVCEGKDNKIWIGTDRGGLNCLDKAQNNSMGTAFLHDPQNANSIAGNVVKTMLKDQEDRIWLGIYGMGVSVYDPNKEYFIHYKSDYHNPKSLSNNTVWSMAERQNGDIWIATLGRGISVYQKASKDFRQYEHDPENPKSLAEQDIKSFFVDANDRVWLGTDNSGLDIWDETSNTFEHYVHNPEDSTSISNNEIRAITADEEGRIWIGTEGGGLNRWLGDGRFERITKEDGLIANNAMGITVDQEGLLWISTFEGISRLNPETKEIRNFDFRNPENSNQFNQDACLTASDGTLFFGGINGLHAIRPEEVKKIVPATKLIFTAFNLFNKRIKAGQAVEGQILLERPIEETESIDLSYVQNSFSIAFAAIDYTNPLENTFSYKMDGFDTEWQLLPIGQHQVSYTNLDPGAFTFRVKHKTVEAQLEIEIYPPFWKTWWFELLAICFFIASLLGLIQFITRRKEAAYQKMMLEAEREILQLKNEKLAEEVSSKNSELLYSAVQMAHKNEILTNIKDELKDNPDAEKKLRALLRTVDREINDEDYWKEFNLYFNQVDKNFVQALVATHPKLTQNDIRICTLMRIQLSTKEIASLLNVSVRAVEQSRYRLKKRLELGNTVNLNGYIAQFRGEGA